MRTRFSSLYIHVPFCRGKCGYCAFYSQPQSTAPQRVAYLVRLEQEFAEFATQCGPLTSVFLGGGTPSALSAAELRRLLRAVHAHFRLADHCEITTEANPESLTPAKIAALADGGINRVSIGVQSFRPALRRTLLRRGSLVRLESWFRELRRAGIANLGVDLIYAIPGQTLAAWEAEIAQAGSLGISHLSTYSLTLEEGSRLAQANLPPVDDDLAVDMWHAAANAAAPFELRRYEVSNFAHPGRECRHNLEIWHGTTYLGCGPAAASYNGQLRWTNPADVDAWMLNPIPRCEDCLDAPARAAEVFAFGLRTVAGWRWPQFEERTGFDARTLCGPAIAALLQEELLEETADGIRPTCPRGLLFADAVAERLLL